MISVRVKNKNNVKIPVIDKTDIKRFKRALDELYDRYNHREYVNPDPLIFLYNYDDTRDREIAALVASSLAYGRVAQILKSVDLILSRMDSPSEFLKNESNRSIQKAFKDFKHRFTTGEDISRMLTGTKRAINRHGSLEKCFKKGIRPDDENLMPALMRFVAEIRNGKVFKDNGLMPCPSDGSACKRWNLFLRWMVRKDNVDPGGWDLPSSKLIVPLDTHMYKIGIGLGFTNRKQADLKTAIEITNVFREINANDPVRYDFALTRLGIRNDISIESFINRLKKEVA